MCSSAATTGTCGSTGGQSNIGNPISKTSSFVRRVIHAHARRVAAGDVDALPDMTGLAAELDEAITQAVIGLRTTGIRGPRSRPGSASPARQRSNDGANGSSY